MKIVKKVKKVVKKVAPAPLPVSPPPPPPPPPPAPVTPFHLFELEEIGKRIGSGTSTVGDHTRVAQIGEALSRGLPVPPKVVGIIADHRNGRGRLWSRGRHV